MAWFAKLPYPGRLAVHAARGLTQGARSLASSTTTTAAQAKILRAERERAAPQSSDVNYDGPYSAPEMKTTMPGPKSRVLNIVADTFCRMICSKSLNDFII